MAIWTRKPQEQEGPYLFSGTLYITQGVRAKLSDPEIMSIYLNILDAVVQSGGVDYLQIYESNEGSKVYFIDQCSPDMMEVEGFNQDFNYCTILLPSEY
jgi:hypothetical protein